MSGESKSSVRRSLLAWWLLGLGLLLVFADVVAAYLGWFVFGLFTYYLARPVSRRIERAVGSATLGAGLTLLLIAIPILFVIVTFLLVALGQFAEILADERIAALVGEFLPVQTETLPNDPEDVSRTLLTLLEDPSVQSLVGVLGESVVAATAMLYNLFVAVLLAFFLLVSDRTIAGWFRANVVGEQTLAANYLSAVDAGLSSVYFGYTLTIFVIMILASIIYNVFNFFAPAGLLIPATILLGVATGVMTLVPLVGRSVVYVFIVLFLALEAVQIDPILLWYPVLFFVLMVAIFDNVVRTYIRPYLSGRMFSMGLVMFAYLLGPPLYGWYGIFLGPLLLVVGVLFVRIVLPRLVRSDAVSGLSTGPVSDADEQRHGEKSSDGQRDDEREERRREQRERRGRDRRGHDDRDVDSEGKDGQPG